MKAIISDIHSNLEALQAVLKDIEQFDIEAVYCLGDVVGYGPNPRECVDLVMDCKLVLLGNHDQGAMFDPEGFNPPAERAIFWTREQLESAPESRSARNSQRFSRADRVSGADSSCSRVQKMARSAGGLKPSGSNIAPWS